MNMAARRAASCSGIAMILGAVLAGCSAGPNYRAPKPDVPAAFVPAPEGKRCLMVSTRTPGPDGGFHEVIVPGAGHGFALNDEQVALVAKFFRANLRPAH